MMLVNGVWALVFRHIAAGQLFLMMNPAMKFQKAI